MEKYQYFLLAFQTFVFVLYVIHIVSKYGIQSSLSHTFYIINEPNWFRFFCYGIGLPFLFYAEPIFMLSTFGLVLVGVASDYQLPVSLRRAFKITQPNRMTNLMHYIGAGIGISTALIGINLILFFVFVVGSILLSLLLKNKIWWIEVYAFILILLGFPLLY